MSIPIVIVHAQARTPTFDTVPDSEAAMERAQAYRVHIEGASASR
jgi:hypothetical protein